MKILKYNMPNSYLIQKFVKKNKNPKIQYAEKYNLKYNMPKRIILKLQYA